MISRVVHVSAKNYVVCLMTYDFVPPERNKVVLQLADDSTGVLQRGVRRGLRYSSSDASERRPGRGTSEAGNQISSPGSRKTVLVSEVASVG